MVPMVRKGRIFLIAMWLTGASASASASSSAFETCDVQDKSAPRATLTLRSTFEDKAGNFVGLFQFHNIDLAQSVKISGAGDQQGFSVRRPQAKIQFKDLNGSWTTLIPGPPEEYLGTTSALHVASKSTVTLRIVLFPKKLVMQDGSDFRLLLSFADPGSCMASLPFRALRPPGGVQGFVSVAPDAPVPIGTAAPD